MCSLSLTVNCWRFVYVFRKTEEQKIAEIEEGRGTSAPEGKATEPEKDVVGT